MMTSVCRFALLMTMLATGACTRGHISGETVLTTGAGSYEPGEEVAVTLTNGTDEEIGYNICFAFLSLERETDGGWQRVPVPLGPTPDAACTMQIEFLVPGERAESTVYLPVDLDSGTYRLGTDVEMEGVHTVVQTPPFEVSR